METHIYDEKNGLSYTLHGDYYLPNLVLNEEKPIYGKYGMLRKQFLKEHRLAKYQYFHLRQLFLSIIYQIFTFLINDSSGNCSVSMIDSGILAFLFKVSFY